MKTRFLIFSLILVLASWAVHAQQPAWRDVVWGNIEKAERIVFACDISGSIDDERLSFQKTLIIELVTMLIQNELNPMVEVIAFHSDIEVIVQLASLNEIKDTIVDDVNRIEVTTRLTWLNGAIDYACSTTQPVHPNGALVLSTDGLPTTAERNGSRDDDTARDKTRVAAENFKTNCSNLTVIGIDLSGEAEEFLREIASPGAFLSVTTPPLIAYVRHGDGSEIYVMNGDGSDQERVGETSDYDHPPAWSPDGTRIAFSLDDDIYIINADGSDQKNLSNSEYRDRNPVWSPDGNRILFVSRRDGNREIYVMNADGSNQRNLTQNEAYEGRASWSPDGNRILFVSDRDGNGEIYVMNADGSNQRNLTQNEVYDTSPSWSPDGNRILFVSRRDGNREIYVMNADGSNQRNLASGSCASWSPDGTRIAFFFQGNGELGLFVMNTDGSDVNRVAYPGYVGEPHRYLKAKWPPAWSPDGTYIAYVALDGYADEIYVVKADGSGLMRLTYTRWEDRWKNGAPAWSP